jgi:hypothetical protein
MPHVGVDGCALGLEESLDKLGSSIAGKWMDRLWFATARLQNQPGSVRHPPSQPGRALSHLPSLISCLIYCVITPSHLNKNFVLSRPSHYHRCPMSPSHTHRADWPSMVPADQVLLPVASAIGYKHKSHYFACPDQ